MRPKNLIGVKKLNFKEVKNRIKYLRKKINYHNKKYYYEDNPEITDYEYDTLLKELENLEDSFPKLKTKFSPTKKIGGGASKKFSSVTHSVPMQSLHDSFSKDELLKFDKRVRSVVKNVSYIVEPKIDGLSVSLEYKNGIFFRGSTRGDGEKGEDITENLLTIKDIPKILPEKIEYLEVRGEIYMSESNFLNFTKQCENLEKPVPKNPRNAAAGSLRQKDARITASRNLNCIVFNIQSIRGKSFTNHKESIDFLRKLNFKASFVYGLFNEMKQCFKIIDKIGKEREKFSFSIDGAVIKVNNFKDREKLGITSKFPKWAEAYKYPPEEKKTKLLRIDLNVGRTGVVTPVGIFESLLLAGTTVSRATLHNESMIKEKDIRIGDVVKVRKAGEIIPEIIDVALRHRSSSKIFEMPKNCPSCGCKLLKDPSEIAIRCINTNCRAQIVRNLIHFASKDAMNIEGLGLALIETLVDKGLVLSPGDFYRIKKEDLLLFGKNIEKSISNWLSAIEASKSSSFDRVLFALGIRHVGKESSKLLARHFKTMYNLANAPVEDIQKIDGFGPAASRSVNNYFSSEQNKKLIKDLEKFGLIMQVKEIESKKERVLLGKTFVLTGTLPNYKRSDITKIIEDLGGKVSSSVSKKIDFVLYGNEAGSKLAKARTFGISCITQDEFLKIIENR
ncbi:MAG: NAD-dependent DNA ligase LigA [Oscillospiraceae bacterium]|jgi:DNA ligase (NAD+)|nr:NAD-dependent DNA ligase LigA [Oscillospiraceae bacterium]